jgi:hypothetical protein
MAKLRPSGGYRELRSFQIATIIYDATYWFCKRFLDSRSRMSDQMVQAARSGRQNIKDIDFCLAFDLVGLADRPEIDYLRTLHEILKARYGSGDE